MNSEQIGMANYERIEALRDKQKELRDRLLIDGHDPVIVAELKDIAVALKAAGERP